ncbi:helix-turn-helix transcriptional regulator [Slackia exigua]|uniref:helix-turn-helix transcriptional regulator n=1 Tax=Slackia exigua TaxID=84109 RepID=UPI0028DB7CDB|nr:LuxR C-terminal-related transcriptional regulator [Slackia exigua]
MRGEAEGGTLQRGGCSVPYTAENLRIADNTVKYHCKSICRKPGVRSRQELFDLLDGRSS